MPGTALLGAALTLGTLLRISDVLGAELWLDEYHSLIVAGAPSIGRVLDLVAADPHPPVYWILLHLVLRLLGSEPLVARGLSLAFGSATLFVATRVALRRWGTPPAFATSVLLGGSALAIHYSSEIRPYALVALLLLLGLLATESALDRPSPRTAFVQAAVFAVALWVSFFSLTLLAVGPVLALARRNARRLTVQVAISAVALAASSPPLVRVITTLPPEANEYVQAVWAGRTAVDALFEVGRDLLPSARWPLAHGSGARREARDTALEILAFAGALLAALGAVRIACRRSRAGATLESACLVLLCAAAALAATSLLLDRPVVTPGRFAASFLPPVALLGGAATTWGRAGRIGAFVLTGVAGLNVAATLAAPAEPIRVDRGRVASIVVAQEFPGPLLVVSVGLTGTPVKHELLGRKDVAYASFPLDVDTHFGWWAPKKALAEPGVLEQDAEELVRRAVVAAREGRAVVVTGADHPIAAPLREELSRIFDARPLHPVTRGAYVLSLRERPRAEERDAQRR